ncbi:hypothetical protein WICPIJ_005376 [Wickerhamomyces pijperi]|uniref:Uncharacterized protein n=1 Tax=Wickerhamomyces pijperi TaxID=599730 RepID=A0A9P8Q4A1_WICPI|nr:hypothetical protein WICPIJ_005376 [Wickerhamomyces pijperi]
MDQNNVTVVELITKRTLSQFVDTIQCINGGLLGICLTDSHRVDYTICDLLLDLCGKLNKVWEPFEFNNSRFTDLVQTCEDFLLGVLVNFSACGIDDLLNFVCELDAFN